MKAAQRIDPEAKSARIDALRAEIRTMEGGSVGDCRRAPSGLDALDALTGGVPVPGLVEVNGPLGGGAHRLVLGLVAAALRRGRRVAWVDGPGWFHPPGAAALGVEPSALCLVRPPVERAGWAVEQLLRAGCFPLVVVDGVAAVGHAGHRWARAAEAGCATALVLAERPSRAIPAAQRLSVQGGVVSVVRDRLGAWAPRVTEAPAPSDGVDRWIRSEASC